MRAAIPSSNMVIWKFGLGQPSEREGRTGRKPGKKERLVGEMFEPFSLSVWYGAVSVCLCLCLSLSLSLSVPLSVSVSLTLSLSLCVSLSLSVCLSLPPLSDKVMTEDTCLAMLWREALDIISFVI